MNQTHRIHIGFRTIKTTIAVIISMIIVYGYGVSTSKLIFAMLGAMAAITPTFKDSLESCITQIFGVLFGAAMSVILLSFSLHPLVTTGIGIVLIITLYNAFGIRFSPTLPCMIVVMMCTTTNIQPFAYAFERIWDSTIGLTVGLLINTLVFPYDNSKLIKDVFKQFDEELILLLGKLFVISEEEVSVSKLEELCHEMDRQMEVYSKQILLFNYKNQKETLEELKNCQEIARRIYSYMDVMTHMQTIGELSEKNYASLKELEVDLTNYEETGVEAIVNVHLETVLELRKKIISKIA